MYTHIISHYFTTAQKKDKIVVSFSHEFYAINYENYTHEI